MPNILPYTELPGSNASCENLLVRGTMQAGAVAPSEAVPGLPLPSTPSVTTFPTNPNGTITGPVGAVVLARDGGIYMRLDPLSDTAWERVDTGGLAFGAQLGDGSDGDVTLPLGTTTLTRDMSYNSLVIPVGAILNPAGFWPRVKGRCTLLGSVQRNGPNGAGGNGATGAAGGIAPSGGTLPSGSSGGSGAPGAGLGNTAGSGAGVAPRGFSAAAAAAGVAAGAGVIGGSGGAGGPGHGGGSGAGGNPSGVGYAGAVGGVLTLAPATHGDVRRYEIATTGRSVSNVSFTCGSGGAGGGGGQTGGGGGGGAAGGWLVISAREFVGNGTIEAKGGNGGNATGNGGGGGGGGGGVAVVIIAAGAFPTMVVTGGLGGTGGGTAPGGGAGGNGGDGITVPIHL